MFRISSNGIVTVNRGDSFSLPIQLNVGYGIEYIEYELSEEDVVYLGVMEPNQPFETAIVRKVFNYDDFISNGSVVFRFWPEDTVCLCPGKYYYQVKLQTTDGKTGRKDVETVIEKTLFYIQE